MDHDNVVERLMMHSGQRVVRQLWHARARRARRGHRKSLITVETDGEVTGG